MLKSFLLLLFLFLSTNIFANQTSTYKSIQKQEIRQQNIYNYEFYYQSSVVIFQKKEKINKPSHIQRILKDFYRWIIDNISWINDWLNKFFNFFSFTLLLLWVISDRLNQRVHTKYTLITKDENYYKLIKKFFQNKDELNTTLSRIVSTAYDRNLIQSIIYIIFFGVLYYTSCIFTKPSEILKFIQALLGLITISLYLSAIIISLKAMFFLHYISSPRGISISGNIYSKIKFFISIIIFPLYYFYLLYCYLCRKTAVRKTIKKALAELKDDTSNNTTQSSQK